MALDIWRGDIKIYFPEYRVFQVGKEDAKQASMGWGKAG